MVDFRAPRILRAGTVFFNLARKFYSLKLGLEACSSLAISPRFYMEPFIVEVSPGKDCYN